MSLPSFVNIMLASHKTQDHQFFCKDFIGFFFSEWCYEEFCGPITSETIITNENYKNEQPLKVFGNCCKGYTANQEALKNIPKSWQEQQDSVHLSHSLPPPPNSLWVSVAKKTGFPVPPDSSKVYSSFLGWGDHQHFSPPLPTLYCRAKFLERVGDSIPLPSLHSYNGFLTQEWQAKNNGVPITHIPACSQRMGPCQKRQAEKIPFYCIALMMSFYCTRFQKLVATLIFDLYM